MRITEGELQAAAQESPDAFRSALLGAGGEAFAKGLLDSLVQHRACPACKCSGRHVSWYRTFARVAKLVDAPALAMQINVLLADLGVSTIDEAKRAVALVRSGGAMSIEEQTEEALALMRYVMLEKPETRMRFLAAAGGREIEANGNGAHP